MENFIVPAGNLKLPLPARVIVACGVFDGVHYGHRRIIECAKARAQEKDCRVLALSFSPHPRQLLSPVDAPALLVSKERRISLLQDAGADLCAFINFTEQVAALEPLDFLRRLAENPFFEISGICVGKNWRFGRLGSGRREILADFCSKKNWSFDAVAELEKFGIIISSSAIRQAVAAGDLVRAKEMLGRPAELEGVVVHGFAIAKNELSAPTANLEVSAGVMPPDGVYSGTVKIGQTAYPAALNIGIAPTYGNDLHRVEIHLIGFDGDLYGKKLVVALNRFLRKERCFASPQELKAQIFADIAEIKEDFRLQNQ